MVKNANSTLLLSVIGKLSKLGPIYAQGPPAVSLTAQVAQGNPEAPPKGCVQLPAIETIFRSSICQRVCEQKLTTAPTE